MRPRLAAKLLLASVVLGHVPGIFGQSTFGRLVGTVTDSSGAAVADTSVSVRSEDEGAISSANSDRSGFYEISHLKPGRYSVNAEKTGFATATIAELHLGARETLRADLTVQIASLEQSVTVGGTVPLINTESAVIADTKSFHEITTLPLNYRGTAGSPLIATITVPGVQHDAKDRGRPSLAGGFPAQIEYSVDGISTLGAWTEPNDNMNPSTEMLSEFRVTSAGSNAEFGQMGDVSIITRSGTRELHGSAIWYGQNAALDARIYGSTERSKKVANTFGASLGGPVVLPNIYGGREKTFFFVDYEANRRPQPRLIQTSVPSATMRLGDLNGVPGPPASDPSTGAPFPENQIPVSRINSVARTLLQKYYPLPNFNYDGTTNSNYRELFPYRSNTDGYDVRVDHLLPRSQIFARWSWKQLSGPVDNFPLPAGTFRGLDRSLILAYNYSFRPNLINESRFGFSLSDSRDEFPILGTDAVNTLGLQGLDLSKLAGMTGFPLFNFSEGTDFAPIGRSRAGALESRNWQFTDNLSWIYGRHTVKIGTDIRSVSYAHNNRDDPSGDFGTFTFLQDSFTGNAFADLLLGLPAMDAYGTAIPDVRERGWQTHIYAQDEWRAGKRLTLSYGLRWSVHFPMTEDAGNIANFDRSTASVIVPDQTLPPALGFLAGINACPGVTDTIPCTHMLSASEANLGGGLRRTYYNNWGPRVGIAWRPGTSTVIRSGFGIFTQTIGAQTAYLLTGVHTSDFRRYTNFRGEGVPPLFVLPQISAGPLQVPEVGTMSFEAAINPLYKDPTTYQWNLSVERQLPKQTTVRLSYIGSASVGLNLLVDLNQQPASTTAFDASRRPYPAWQSVRSVENLGFARYNAMQVEATRRFGGALSFQSSYVLSKNIGNAGSGFGGYLLGSAFPAETFPALVLDPFNPGYSRGELGGSRRHRFLLTAIYNLPFGRGRPFGSHMNRLADAIVGGWDLSTITLLQTGPYLTPIMGASRDQSNTGMASRVGVARPDRIGNGNIEDPTPDRWWDAAAFVPPPKGAARFGNSGVGVLQGPGTIAVAAGLFKTFRLTEVLRLRVEGTFTNLPNHPNFGQPGLFIDRPGFGQVTAVQKQENSGNRVGQLGARLEW